MCDHRRVGKALLVAVCALASCDRALGLDRIHPLPDAAPDAGPVDGLVAYYPFDVIGPPSACAADMTLRGHDAACINGMPTLATSMHGNAFVFDGATELHVADSPDLDSTGAWTVAFWFQQSDRPDLECAINRPLGGRDADSWQFCLQNATPYDLAGSFASYVPNALTADQWHHLAMTWSNPNVVAYVDGASVLSANGMGIAFDQHGIELGVDIDFGTVRVPFIGELDELRIYNRTLTPAEIALLAQ